MQAVLVTGSRDWTDARIIQQVLVGMGPSRLVHGAARGADRLAGEAAVLYGYEVVEYPARWEELGRSAGPMRNQQMLDAEDVVVVVAFHDDLANSRGTADMVRRAKAKGIPVYLISHA